MSMLEQTVKTEAWKMLRGLAECDKYRPCSERKETIEHLMAGYKWKVGQKMVLGKLKESTCFEKCKQN